MKQNEDDITPYVLLWRTVICECIDDALSLNKVFERNYKKETIEEKLLSFYWIMAHESRTNFEMICDMAGYNHEEVRRVFIENYKAANKNNCFTSSSKDGSYYK